ncbi:DIP1984 family protein [Frondihabitans cladoniiphilus]|uniref:DIP1984 family protein n=1 Tax=Frondihabitans cladoniiphilus TaxID=715785 RepID=A0ABP8W548_9MICO
MKLAEALINRADLQKRIEQMRSRITANARYQEGEEPSEDAAALLLEVGTLLDALEQLVVAVNLTNASTLLDDGRTMTEALAHRDMLRSRHAILVAAADASSGSGDFGGYRQLRSELRQVSALPTSQIRSQADDVARRLRELDVLVQQANWEADLAD